MKAGAHDYVMKNNLTRLLPAIDRELREAANRRAHQAAQATIRHMAYHDSLTELHNRAEFERRLHAAVETARQSGRRDHALLYLDLDQFKLVNDSCGHLAGDELLRRLARRLQRGIRESDTLARLGGDEFGVLLKSCPLERAKQLAQGLLDSIRDYRFIWGDRSFKVGASIGLVRVRREARGRQVCSAWRTWPVMPPRTGAATGYMCISRATAELRLRRGEMKWIQRLQAAHGEP